MLPKEDRPLSWNVLAGVDLPYFFPAVLDIAPVQQSDDTVISLRLDERKMRDRSLESLLGRRVHGARPAGFVDSFAHFLVSDT
jgi:hypothetical protein